MFPFSDAPYTPSSVVTVAGGGGKSSRIPDTDPLVDGKEPTFELWKKSILSKFDINFDHYTSEAAKMAYIFNMTKGDAKGHLEPRYKSDDGNEFRTFREMMDYLGAIYVDPFKVRNAKLKYRSPASSMKSSQTFSEYYTEFLQLASTAKIPLEDYRDDLIDKLTLNLQKALMANETEYTDHQSLAKYLTGLDQRQRHLKEREDFFNKRKNNGRATVTPVASTTATSAAAVGNSSLRPSNSAPAQSAQNHPRQQWTEEQKKLAHERRCFHCKEAGHRAFECPKKEGSVRAIDEVVAELPVSGKEEP